MLKKIDVLNKKKNFALEKYIVLYLANTLESLDTYYIFYIDGTQVAGNM